MHTYIFDTVKLLPKIDPGAMQTMEKLLLVVIYLQYILGYIVSFVFSCQLPSFLFWTCSSAPMLLYRKKKKLKKKNPKTKQHQKPMSKCFLDKIHRRVSFTCFQCWIYLLTYLFLNFIFSIYF